MMNLSKLQNELDETTMMNILPKRSEEIPLRVKGLSQEVEFRTNCYDIQLTGKSLFMYQYVVQTDPVIPLDSAKIWFKLVKDIETRLQKAIGLVSHRGNTLWGNKCLEGESLDLIWTSRYRTRYDPTQGKDSLLMSSSLNTSLIGQSSVTSGVVKSDATSSIKNQFNPQMIGKSFGMTSEFNFSAANQTDGTKIKEKKAKIEKQERLYKQNQTKYRVSIRLTNKLDLKQLLTDESQRGKIIQIINIKIKDKLQSLGYMQLGKGRFYEKSRLGMDRLEQVGLQVLRGFKFSLVALKKDKLCFQIDPCTRIMQSQNLLQIIQSMGKHNVMRLKGAIVMSRYGNYKTYKIDSIDYRMSPNSYFFVNDTRKGKQSNSRAPKIKKTYFQYFKQAYGMTITNLKQPLVRIYEKPTKVIKRGAIKQKPKYLYLVPELLSLTGMTQDQRKNNAAMKALAPYTKLPPKTRFMETQKLIHQIQASDNSKGRNDFSMIAIKEPTMVKGFQLNPVLVTMKQTSVIQNGEFSLRKPLMNPAKLDDWLLFCSNATKHQKIKDFISCLDKASKDLGILLKNPFINVVGYQQGDKDFRSQRDKWIESIRKELNKDNDLPQIIVVYLQSFQEKFYPDIKRLLINQYGVVSQAVKAQTFQKLTGALSVATGVIVQINQKVGKTVWKIERNHQQFTEQNYQVFSNIKKQSKKPEQSHSSIVDQSRISYDSKRKEKKHKHQKKDKKQKKQKKEKKDHKEQKQKKEKRTTNDDSEIKDEKYEKAEKNQDLSEEKSINQNDESQDTSKLEVSQVKIQESSISLMKSEGESLIANLLEDESRIQEKQKKQKKEKKQKKQKKEKKEKEQKGQKKDDKKQKKEKKEKKQKKQEKGQTVPILQPAQPQKQQLTYEEIRARKLERETMKALKKDPVTYLPLTSNLQIASAGFSSSTNPATSKFTLSFVGTTNKQQSQVYTHCRYGMRRKDFLPDLEYEVIFNHWLKTYYEKSRVIIDGNQHYYMPSVLVVYREGLSDAQLRKQVLREVRILKKVIANKVPKSLNYDPEIIYLTVNKHPSTRYFAPTSKNAAPGSVIFDHFSSTMNFHLISQHVSEGSSTPTQYRIAYRNRFTLSDGALAQFTYELCYGYYNWAGGVRIPAPLQCAAKLARLVGESVRQNVFKIDKKKSLAVQTAIVNELPKSNLFEHSFINQLETSSISSIGQSTLFNLNMLNLQTSMDTSSQFNLSKNLNKSKFQNFTSFSGIGEQKQKQQTSKEMRKVKAEGNKAEGKPKDKERKFDKEKDKKFLKKDIKNKNLSFKKNDEQKREPKQRMQRKKEIVDTFFFL